MYKIEKGDKIKLANRLWFLAGLAVFFIFAIGLAREVVNRRQINRQITEYEEKIAVLKMENETLGDKIQNWNTSGELEMNARNKLGLEKPGEQTIIIKRSEPASAQAVAISSNQEIINLDSLDSSVGYEPNPAKWWKYFFR